MSEIIPIFKFKDKIYDTLEEATDAENTYQALCQKSLDTYTQYEDNVYVWSVYSAQNIFILRVIGTYKEAFCFAQTQPDFYDTHRQAIGEIRQDNIHDPENYIGPRIRTALSDKRQYIENGIRQGVKSIIGHFQISPSDSFIHDLGFDELDMMELSLYLENHFNIEISESEIKDLITVGDMYDLLYKKIA